MDLAPKMFKQKHKTQTQNERNSTRKFSSGVRTKVCPQEEREVHLMGVSLILEDFPERVVGSRVLQPD